MTDRRTIKVFAVVDGNRRVVAHRHKDGLYKCFPKNTNKVARARCFSDLQDAAAFLILHPDWGIRMEPDSPIIYENIQITRF